MLSTFAVRMQIGKLVGLEERFSVQIFTLKLLSQHKMKGEKSRLQIDLKNLLFAKSSPPPYVFGGDSVFRSANPVNFVC